MVKNKSFNKTHKNDVDKIVEVNLSKSKDNKKIVCPVCGFEDWMKHHTMNI